MSTIDVKVFDRRSPKKPTSAGLDEIGTNDPTTIPNGAPFTVPDTTVTVVGSERAINLKSLSFISTPDILCLNDFGV